MNLFNAYRKMFASHDVDEEVVWWYCGVVMSQREGVGVVPLTEVETIMVYRTRDIAPDTFTIDWTEVGYFRDIHTGEPLDGWFNPFSGLTEPYPKSFVDGPATFTVKRVGDDGPEAGVDISLVQHNARIDGVALQASVNARSLGLVQTETKTRTFHRPDGSLPGLDSPEATAFETVLSIWSDLEAVNDAGRRNVASHGFYSGSGKAGGAGSWAQTKVQGTMYKARPEERVNPIAWDRLQRIYPAFFKGERIAPDWT